MELIIGKLKIHGENHGEIMDISKLKEMIICVALLHGLTTLVYFKNFIDFINK